MDRLRLLFGNETVPARPQAIKVSRWGQEPYSLGSYSTNPPRVDSRANYELGGGERAFGGRLRFAGEATCSLMFATIHGAYVSGLREACALLGPRCTESTWPWFAPEVRTLCEVAPLPDDATMVTVGSSAMGRARGQGQQLAEQEH